MTPADVLPHLRRLVDAFPAMRRRDADHIRSAMQVYSEELAALVGGYRDPEILPEMIRRAIRSSKFFPSVAEIAEHLGVASNAVNERHMSLRRLLEDQRATEMHARLRAAFDAEQGRL